MTYNVSTIFNLLQFNYGHTVTDIARQAGIKVSQMHSAKRSDVITKKTREAIAGVYGDDWDSTENIRLYQKRKNIVSRVDPEKLMQLRVKKELSKLQAAKIFGITTGTLEDFEAGTKMFRSWPEYMKYVNFYKDDLMIVEKPKVAKKSKQAKQFMTFKNIATRGSKVCWQVGRRIVV